MEVDMSTKELKAASTALTVAIEVAKERLGKGECIEASMLLRGLTEAQLDEFIRICRELERFFDSKLIPQPEGSIIERPPPSLERELREFRGKYE